MKGRTTVSVKVEPTSTSRLISTVFISYLYFIYVIKIYVR